MTSKKNPECVPLLRSTEAFQWNVAIPFDPTCYGAKTIQSMAKLANRRGEIRWFMVEEDGSEMLWRLHQEPIKGVDFLEDFLSDLLEDKPQIERDAIGNLVVSFSEEGEARAFGRDLELLQRGASSTKRRKPLSPIEYEQKERKERAAASKRSQEEYVRTVPLHERQRTEAILKKAADDLKAQRG